MNRTSINKEQTLRENENELLKLTALIYLEDAIVAEHFEEAEKLLKTVREYGASDEEVESVTFTALRRLNGASGSTEDEQIKNRLQQYQEADEDEEVEEGGS